MFAAGAIGAAFIGAGFAGGAFGVAFGGGAEFASPPGLFVPLASEFGAAPRGVPAAGRFVVSAGAVAPAGAFGTGEVFASPVGTGAPASWGAPVRAEPATLLPARALIQRGTEMPAATRTTRTIAAPNAI